MVCAVAIGLWAFLTAASRASVAGFPYLLETMDTSARGAGSVVATPEGGFMALGANPAALVDGPVGLGLLQVRVPETRVQILTSDANGGLKTQALLISEGYSFGIARRSFSLGEGTRLGASVGFRGAGRFDRVDNEGTAVNAFPATDWRVALSLAQRLGPRLAAGVTSSWLRSKVTGEDGSGRYGFGWAFDVGLRYRPSAQWVIGLTARNLSHGLSLPDPDLPRDPRHEVAVGARRAIPLSSWATLDLAGDLRFPSHRGVQTSAGATLRLSDDAGVSVGYMRRVERWRTTRIDADDRAQPDTRLWVLEGPTFGAWVRAGGWRIGGATSPVFLPTAADETTRFVETNRWLWSISIGRNL